MWAGRRCELVVEDATGGRGWIEVKEESLDIFEALSGVRLLVTRSLEGFSLDGTEGHDTADPDWDLLVTSSNVVEGANTVGSVFVVVSSAICRKRVFILPLDLMTRDALIGCVWCTDLADAKPIEKAEYIGQSWISARLTYRNQEQLQVEL